MGHSYRISGNQLVRCDRCEGTTERGCVCGNSLGFTTGSGDVEGSAGFAKELEGCDDTECDYNGRRMSTSSDRSLGSSGSILPVDHFDSLHDVSEFEAPAGSLERRNDWADEREGRDAIRAGESGSEGGREALKINGERERGGGGGQGLWIGNGAVSGCNEIEEDRVESVANEALQPLLPQHRSNDQRDDGVRHGYEHEPFAPPGRSYVGSEDAASCEGSHKVSVHEGWGEGSVRVPNGQADGQLNGQVNGGEAHSDGRRDKHGRAGRQGADGTGQHWLQHTLLWLAWPLSHCCWCSCLGRPGRSEISRNARRSPLPPEPLGSPAPPSSPTSAASPGRRERALFGPRLAASVKDHATGACACGGGRGGGLPTSGI